MNGRVSVNGEKGEQKVAKTSCFESRLYCLEDRGKLHTAEIPLSQYQ